MSINNNILLKYNEIIFPDSNVISNGNCHFYKGSERGNISIDNSVVERTLIIKNFFSAIKALSSVPKYVIGVEKLNIYVSYYRMKNKKNKNIRYALNQNTVNNLGDLLSKKLKRKVELRFINLKSPYLDRTIRAEYMGKNASMHRFRGLRRNAIKRTKIKNNKFIGRYKGLESNLPSDMIGLKIVFSGRLVTERLRPRKTVSTAKIGSFTRNNELLIEHGSYTGKNARGAYTVKVLINHKKGKNYI
ncbi:ribosomal protein S3 (mitochondrion) [Cutaneotrichosporon cavernicola]|uniref:Small ribosomal subunit protein uS3m n=1 Tax=Cutaneotrichosporon cavernicola TaxID=279322 RepID=A0AA48QYX9_9TREE|nr:ribosomal protein S3 [Cutaneotrichosporon cavernicola]BEI95042.1 ribosomal protein S3 [Cutaneotrichosporon cavernicola]BEJ02816.1 ribosomal protein S3 [Cutaneotrichosporon cavernicola]BEJ10569.1 ribosomal protein S3 [Cutaneotrichosporon cavernicola]